MRKTILLLVIIGLVVAVGCSRRRTRQFIVPEAAEEGYTVGEWTLEPPAVVAFKDVIKLDGIDDTTMFWVSLRAHRLRPKNPESDVDLIVDSVNVLFLPDNSTYWRIPTRAAKYGTPGSEEINKVFDFFGDQGIVIPSGIDIILLRFDAVSVAGENRTTHPMEFRMIREEQMLKVPLLQQ